MPSKLKLDLNALRVDAFETSAPEMLRATVHAHASTVGERICTCDSEAGTCESCYAGQATCGCGTGGTGGTGNSIGVTCATGGQRICSCGG